MKNVVIELRGGRVVEIYAEEPGTEFTVVDWDETTPDGLNPPSGCNFPAVAFSRLPSDTLLAYRTARNDHSDTCFVKITK
jgi:hypothetical protein